MVYSYTPTQILINPFGNFLGIGTTTPFTSLQIASSTTNVTFKPQLILTDNAAGINKKHWFISSEQGTFNIGTTSDKYATTTLITIGTNGQFTKLGGKAVSGVIPVVASADLTGQSGATTITTYTPTATSTLRVGGYITVTAVTLDVAQFQVTYTDETGSAVTANFFPQGVTSANIASTGAFPLSPQDIRVKANTVVTMKTILTTGTGSITYDTGADIEILR